jgi:hypothetical protein
MILYLPENQVEITAALIWGARKDAQHLRRSAWLELPTASLILFFIYQEHFAHAPNRCNSFVSG